MDRRDVVNYLRSLSKGQLTDLLYEVWDDWPRHPNNYYNAENHMPTGEMKLALAEVTFYDGWQNNPEPAQAIIQLVARQVPDWPAPSQAYGDLNQSGQCMKCKVEVVSFAKEAHCPVCGSLTYLT